MSFVWLDPPGTHAVAKVEKREMDRGFEAWFAICKCGEESTGDGCATAQIAKNNLRVFHMTGTTQP